MALDFPANPTNGQIYDSYVYNSTVGAWQAREDSATVAVTSPTAPATANNGDIWYNTNTGVSYVYYADGSSAQWVEIVSSAVPSLDSKADIAGDTFTGTVVAPSFTSNVATGTAPLAVTSTTAVTNLNSDLLDGQHGSYYAPLASPTFTTSATAPRFISTQATGTAPLTVASTTVVSNLNADMIDGYHESSISLTRSDYANTNSSNFNTFVVPGSYTVGGNGNWTGSSNAPTSAYAYGQLVVTTNGNIVNQTYYAHSTSGNYFRLKYNASDWQAWQRISSDYTVTAVGSGGTGSTTAAGARSNLGLEQIKTLYGSFNATSYDSGVGNSGLVWWGEKTVSFGQTFAQIPTISVYCLTTGAVMTAVPIQVSTTGFTFRAIRFQATLGTSDYAWSATGRIS